MLMTIVTSLLGNRANIVNFMILVYCVDFTRDSLTKQLLCHVNAMSAYILSSSALILSNKKK